MAFVALRSMHIVRFKLAKVSTLMKCAVIMAQLTIVLHFVEDKRRDNRQIGASGIVSLEGG